VISSAQVETRARDDHGPMSVKTRCYIHQLKLCTPSDLVRHTNTKCQYQTHCRVISSAQVETSARDDHGPMSVNDA
jgi:hypothetical protein